MAPDKARVLTEHGEVEAVMPRVDLRLPDPGAATALHRRRVVVTGTWSGRRLQVGAVEPDPTDAGLLDLDREDPVSPIPDRQSGPLVSPKALYDDFFRNPPLRPPLGPSTTSQAERDLVTAGTLLVPVGAATGHPLAVVATTEAGSAVRAALADEYGQDLGVAICPWTKQTLHEVTRLVGRVAEEESVLSSIGMTIGSDHFPRATATLLYLPSVLAQRLAPYPDDVLDLTLLVVPAIRRSPVPGEQ
ncbi:MAG TPA: hypothetical protein VI248_14875 [Kineosporiaceae bacterium]